jgi:plasmid stabilization system protein ParE
MQRINITGPAQRDIDAAYDWWSKNRSAEQAVRWYVGIHDAIGSLKQAADRCPWAPERDLLEQGVRQLHFGLGRRPTHRIVFAVDGETVSVLRVRHLAQDALRPDDIVSD